MVLAWPVAAAAVVATHDVNIAGRAYEPAQIPIAVGDTVRWTNNSLERHSVTFGSGTDHVLLPTRQASQSFPQAGTYRYVCTFHENEGMKGTVLVRGTTASTNRSTTTTEPPAGSARTGPDDTSTTTTSSTSTTLPDDPGEATTTTSGVAGTASGAPSPSDSDDTDVDGAAALAALLLLAAGGAAFLVTRTSLP
ncbi:MAG TPA: plastocyanin/azurin family copper-binding protein [Acidimicrobiales bacterium]|nr:plastocyanin/azurin family copper-binding protein [Acidimicrobiales bacterium]